MVCDRHELRCVKQAPPRHVRKNRRRQEVCVYYNVRALVLHVLAELLHRPPFVPQAPALHQSEPGTLGMVAHAVSHSVEHGETRNGYGEAFGVICAKQFGRKVQHIEYFDLRRVGQGLQSRSYRSGRCVVSGPN